MTEKATVTLKDTKAAIMSAYKDALATINDLKAQEFNPAEVKAKEANKKAVEFAEGMQWDLQTVFAQMRNKIDENLRSVQAQLECEKNDLDTIVRAKQALTEELNDLYGISKEAQSFAALVEAQKQRKEAFEAELQQQREATDAYVAEKEAAIDDKLKAWNRENERRVQEWEYNFERECTRRKDELADGLAAAEKKWVEFKEKEAKELEARKDEINKQEAEIAELRKQVASFPEQLEAVKEEAKKKAQQSYAFEVAALKRNHEADMKVLEHETHSLAKARDDLTKKVSDLEAKLESAYEKIQGVASKALEARGNAATTAEVQKAVAAATSGKSR